jgi:hypothetical protein
VKHELLPVLIIPLAILSYLWQMHRTRAILEDWAMRQGYQILEKRHAWFWKGPFFWTTSKSQVVFRILVRDSAGSLREGWVRCGSWWGGRLSDDVEATWDD